MVRKILISKIHRATVTGTDLNYSGSITIDIELMRAAGILAWEWLEVVVVDNGNRFGTYAIPGEVGSGKIQLNGAAARLAVPGDKVILMAFGWLAEDELASHRPRIILVDGQNHVIEIRDLDGEE